MPGVAFGEDGYTFARAAVVRSPFDYTDITIGPDGTPTVEPDPVPLDGPTRARARRARRRRAGAAPAAGRHASGSPPSEDAPVHAGAGYAVAADRLAGDARTRR